MKSGTQPAFDVSHSVCPHCGSILTRAEVGALWSSLRHNRRGGRPRKPQNAGSTPRASELMPEILTLFKIGKEKCIPKKEITLKLREWIARSGYRYRSPAVSYALTYLKNAGLLTNQQRGLWCITAQGRGSKLDLGEAREIERRFE